MVYPKRLTALALATVAVCTTGCGLPIFSNLGVSVSRNGNQLIVEFNGEAPSVGSGNVTTVPRAVPAFSQVSACHGIDIKVVDAAAPSLTVTGDDNLLPLVKTEVSGGELLVELIAGIDTKNPLVVEVAGYPLDRIHAASSARVAAAAMRGASISLKASSSGSVVVDAVEAKSFDISTSSSGRVSAASAIAENATLSTSSAGKIEVAGTTNQIESEASSGGRIEASELNAQQAEANASSAGTIELGQVQELEAAASSGARIVYESAEKFDITSSSGGSVSKREPVAE